MTASETVGCACIVRPSSSAVDSSCIATQASAINSVACGPRICTPEFRRTFLRSQPSQSPLLTEDSCFTGCGKRKFADLYFVTHLACFASVRPTEAISGSQYVQFGTSRKFIGRTFLSPAMCSTATMPSFDASGQQGGWHHVTDGVNAGLRGLHVLIDLNESPFHLILVPSRPRPAV